MTSAEATARVLPALQAIVGPEGVRQGVEAAAYRLDAVAPGAAVLPRNEGEVPRTLLVASQHGLGVVPWGRGAHQSVGRLPVRYDLALDLARLNRVLAYEPADMTITVQAGIGVEDLQRRLGEAGQFLALDPPLADRATVGGVVAANLNGPLRCRYGTVRDLVLEIRVAQADGTITKAGARVVKNATAYDLAKLHVGAHGTLGVILDTTLRVQPRPAVEQGWWLLGDNLERCHDLALRLLGSHLAPNRVELLDGTGGPVCGAPDPGPALTVSFAGVKEAVEDQAATLERLAGETGLRVAAMDNGPEVWRTLQDFPWRSHADASEGRIQWRASVLPSDCAKAMRALRDAATPNGIAMAATVAHGVLRGELLAPSLDAAADGLTAAREAASALGGFLVVTAAPAPIRATLDLWGPPPGGAVLMRQLKAAFDATQVLNAGRFAAGI
jgi:glycolate oxidase FAD binding subunit